MSHEHESSFSVGKQVWHGQAVVLSDNPTIPEAMEAAKTGWTVSTCPLKAEVLTENGIELIDVPGHVATMRDTDKEIYGIVSDKYRPFQNLDGFMWFSPLVEDGTIKLETAGSLQGGRKVWILGRYADDIEVKNGDVIAPYVLMAIGHDGKMSIRINNTPVRVVCMNTARAALGETEDEGMAVGSKFKEVQGGIAIPHIGDVKAKAEMARAAILRMNRELGTTVEQFRKMAKVPVTDEVVREVVRGVFDPDFIKAKKMVDKFKARTEHSDVVLSEEAAVKIAELEAILNDPEKYQNRTTKKVVAALHDAPGAELAGSTVWGLFNAATYHIDHGKASSADSRLASSWFGSGATQRQKVAERCAELIKGR